MNTWRKLRSDLASAGIGQGSRLMIHSSYKSIAPFQRGPTGVVKGFMKTVGSSGQLLFPTFNFQAWPEDHYFDSQKTRSEMGAITEAARLHTDFARTVHPMYSFAVYPRQRFFSQDTYALSGWQDFCDAGGIIIALGLKDLGNAWTIIHHGEMLAKLGNRYWREPKSWTGTIRMFGSLMHRHTFGMYIRKPGVVTNVRPAIHHLIRERVITLSLVCGTTMWSAKASEFVNHIKEIAQTNPEWLYEKEKK